jgi:hypothetical protein
MLTRRIKSNHNNKTKKFNNNNRNKTRKRSQTGGTKKIGDKKNKAKSPRAKGRRGIKLEPEAVKGIAKQKKDPQILSRYLGRRDPTARYDIERSFSKKLPGNYSIKSVARTQPGQKKFQICAGDACNFFSSFLDTEDPLFMAIIIRYEDMLNPVNREIPLRVDTYELTRYKNALFGNITEPQLLEYIRRLRSLDMQSKTKTFQIAKTLKEKRPRITDAEIDKIIDKEVGNIRQQIGIIQSEIEAAGGKLRVRLSKGNYKKKRYPRIIAHFSHDPDSDRISSVATPQHGPLGMPRVYIKSSSSNSEESGMARGSSGAAASARPIPPPSLSSPRPVSASRGASSAKPKPNLGGIAKSRPLSPTFLPKIDELLASAAPASSRSQSVLRRQTFLEPIVVQRPSEIASFVRPSSVRPSSRRPGFFSPLPPGAPLAYSRAPVTSEISQAQSQAPQP